MLLISDPESNNKLVLVFRSGETIRAVGVLGGSFSFTEITQRGRHLNLSPTLGDSSSSTLLVFSFPSGFEILDPPLVSSRGCSMVFPQYLFFGFAAGIVFVLFLAIGAGLLVTACTLGRFRASFLRGSPRSPEGRARFPDCPDA